jgi:hypothetical protein
MATFTTSDGVRLNFVDEGHGSPIAAIRELVR